MLLNRNESFLLFFGSVLINKTVDGVVYTPRVGGPVQQDFS